MPSQGRRRKAILGRDEDADFNWEQQDSITYGKRTWSRLQPTREAISFFSSGLASENRLDLCEDHEVAVDEETD